MKTFMKKNLGFFYWVFLPSVLLVAFVFGVNFIARPAVSLFGTFGIGDGCSTDDECNSLRNNCVVEYCNTVDGTTNYCDISFYETTAGGQCANCNVCGNGRCEQLVNENSATCSLDCLKSAGDTSLLEEVCETTQCGAELFIISQNFTDSTAIPPRFDGCCPVGCQGANSADTLTFDEDCCVQCGDGQIDSLAGEVCDNQATPDGCPAGQFCNGSCQCQSDCGNGILDAGEECDPVLTASPNFGCPVAGQTCNNLCQCSSICGDGTIDPGEQCEPPSTATCDANCQTIVIQQCGNGLVEPGEDCEGTTCNATINGEAIPGVCVACQCIPECQMEGSGCGDDGTGNTGVCFTGTGGTAGGGSLIPVGVHAGVLVQWLAAFAIPGAAFVGLKARRRFKK